VAGMLKAPAAFARQGQQLPPISPQTPWPHESTDGSNIFLISVKVRKS